MSAMKVFVLLITLAIVLALVILISTNFCRFSLLYKNIFNDGDGNETLSADTPIAASMYASPWRVNSTREAIRAKQSQLMQSYINTSVDPCDDFYEYACGNWDKVNPIPNDKWQLSTIHLLHQNLEVELKELLSQPLDVVADPPSAIEKAIIYYKSCLDEDAISQRGTKPLMDFFQELGGWPVLDENWPEHEFDWLQLAINVSRLGSGVIIGYEVEKDPTVPTQNTIYLKQTTLGMLNRDNFLKEENSKNLETYRVLIEKVLKLLHVDEERARNVSQEIVEFEVQLANATLPPEATKTEPYLKLTIQNLIDAYPYVDWVKYFSGVQGAEITVNQSLVIQLGAKYYENLYYLLLRTENHTMANYMVWRCVLLVVVSLDKSFRDAWDDFNAGITGQVEPVPLWKICVNQINWHMGMSTSAMFVRKYFDESSKNETIGIIDALKVAFDENLSELDWVDEKTKSYASRKANAMRIAAGYPDYILSDEPLNALHEDVDIFEGKHFENTLSIAKYYRRQNRGRLFQPYDRDQWFLPPTMVNALYDTGANRILILAGLLQPPVFHQHFPQSLNYGGMGMFMGHEIIHGFDDIGRKFDMEGNALSWWSPEAVFEFEKKQKCFLEQYGNFSKIDNTFKSIATISENLADNGGLRLAYKAYSKWKETNLHPKTVMTETFSNMELNEDQLFFLSFAQLFCAAMRPEALVESKSYEAHSPSKYRVLGALVNFEKFSEVFSCPVGSHMNPNKKCRMW